MRKTKRRRSLKGVLALFLTGVMLISECSAIGSAGMSNVQAEETTTKVITSMDYYSAGDGPVLTKTGVSGVSFGFVMPKFNGVPYTEVALTDVEKDLELQVDVDGTWTNIDDVEYFKFNSTWGWEYQQWGGWICWFKIDETTKIRFHGITNDVNLEYTLQLNKLPVVGIESISCSKTEIQADATGGAALGWENFTFNGIQVTVDNPQMMYDQVKDDMDILVDNNDGKGFVPLLSNAASGFIWDNNFGIYTDGAGGLWFKNVDWSYTLRFKKKDSDTVYTDVKVIYTEVDRTTGDCTLSPYEGTTYDANAAADNAASIGIPLPKIGGTIAVKSDLEKFVYEVKVGDEWKSLSDSTTGWQYQGGGYSKYTVKSQWGYWVDTIYGLWFQPVKEDTDIRIGYPKNGVQGGDIGDNYVTYHFIGNPNAVVPDPKDFEPIVVDNEGEPSGDVTSVTEPEGWKLIWNDEFNGNSVNNSNWTNQTGFLLDETDYTTAGWGNNELEHYTDSPENTSVADGKLKFTMLKDPKTFEDTSGRKAEALYSSGKLISQDKFSVKYGRVDFRAKLPAGSGIWPALWMMPNDDIYGTWASSGELDVFEGKGRTPEMAYATLHYGSQWPGNLNTGDTLDMVAHEDIGSDMTNWHVYSVVWQEGEIKMYVDGICYFKRTSESWSSGGAPGNPNAPFDQRFYLILNLAAGGWFDDGTIPDYDTFEKAEMYVDYVRVYQRPVEDGEDEKPDSAELEEAGKTDGVSNGKTDGLYGDYRLGKVVALENIELDKTVTSLAAGTTETLNVTFTPADATNKSITWTSNNENVATVKNGTITAIKTGTAIITATSADGNFEAACTVTVTGTDVTEIQLNKDTLTLKAGESEALTATILPTDASNQNVTWTSDNKDIATVDETGKVTAVAEGTATITAKAEGGDFKATCVVTVQPVAVTGLTLDKAEATVEAGSTVKVTATVEPENASNQKVIWTSDDVNIATVTNGTIKGISEGSTTITATTEDGSFYKTCTVTVTKKPVVRTEKGAEIVGNDIVFYIKSTTAEVPFYTTLSSADETVNTGNVGSAGTLTTNGEYKEFTITNGAKQYADKYLAFWFNVDPTPVVIKVSDIPVKDSDTSGEESFTVTFNTDGGSSVSSQTVDKGSKVTKPSNPTKSGYTFKGWYLNGTEYDFNSEVTGNITLIAMWESSGTIGEERSEKGAEIVGNDIIFYIKSTTAEVPFYTTLSSADETINTGNVGSVGTLTTNGAYKEFTITNGAVQYADKYLAFWFNTEPTPVVIKVSDIPVKGGNVTQSYTVSFDSDGGSSVSSQTVEEGSKAVKPADPTKTGYTFKGWYNGNTEYDFDTAVTGDITLIAKWEANAPAEIKVANIAVSGSTLTVEEGKTITLTATVSPSNATNKTVTWSSESPAVADVDANGTVTGVAEGTAVIKATAKDGSGVSGDCTVTVTKAAVTAKEYTVSFDSDGGSSVSSQTVEEGSKAVKPADPTKTGYIFKGWYNGTTEYDFNAAVTGNITLTAKWEEIKVSDIAVSGSILVVEEGKTITLTAEVSPADAVNKAVTWSSESPAVATVDANGTVTGVAEGTAVIKATAKDGSGVSGSCEVTVTAKSVIIKTYTVSFDSNGGSSVSSQTVAEGSTAAKPANPTKTGYTFKGWYNGTTEYDFDTAVTGDITLTAAWEENAPEEVAVSEISLSESYVELEEGGSRALTAEVTPENASDKTVTWKSNNEGVAVVTQEGIVYGKKAGTAVITAVSNADNTKTADCAVIVKAKDGGSNPAPAAKSYTVTFYTDGGSAVAAQTVKEGEKAAAPAVPAKAGYAFKGWYNGSTAYDFNTAVTGDITLTAKWEAVKVSSIKLTGISKKIAVNKKITLTATVAPENALNTEVTWSVSNTKYASVDKNGVVKMKSAGKNKTVTVTATAADGSGVKAAYKIQIMPVAVKKITLVAAGKTVKAGKSVKLKAIVSPFASSKKMNKTLQWSSSNEEYATVNAKGVVKTKKAGKGKKVKITAKATDGSNKKKTVTITIK